MRELRSSTNISAVSERPDHHCGDDLVVVVIVVDLNAISNLSDSRAKVRDVILTRNPNEGYGFVIVSSLTNSGSFVGQSLEYCPREK